MDKEDITAEVVVALLREQYPMWADLPVREVEADGNINSSFRLGDELVVRLPGPYNVDVDKELRWLPRLAPHLPLPIPQPVAKGRPSAVFPRDWAIYRWLEGERPDHLSPEDRVGLAVDVARFLAALYGVNAEGGPPAGDHSFGRGGPLTRFDEETRRAIADLSDSIDSRTATALWDAALQTPYTGEPVWVHGDVAPSNLLVRDGRLSAVLDFGASAVGDPACDTVLAWTFLEGDSREAFRQHLPADTGTWVRGRGWAISFALYIMARSPDANPPFTLQCERVVADVLSEHDAEATR